MKTIIAATDFSEPGTNAVHYAASLAKYFNAKLVLVTAYPLVAAGDPQITVDMSVVADASIQSLEKLRKELIQKEGDFGIDCYSAMGTAYGVVKEAVSHYAGDLIVVGMTGDAGRIKQHLIGSTALTVARDLDTPALIVPETVCYKRIHHISLAWDEHLEEEHAFLLAKYFSQLFDAELDVVSVETPGQKATAELSSMVMIDKQLQTVRHNRVVIHDDKIATCLEYYFKFHNTDLVMVDPQKHSFFKRLFSQSVTSQLAFHVQVPLLAIH